MFSNISENHIGFLSGLCGGIMDTLLNYPPYGLHFRRQSGEIINPLKNRIIYSPKELYRGVFAYSWIIPVTCIADGLSTYLVRKRHFETFPATFISGMTAAFFISSPTSNVIITQQKLGLKTLDALRHIITRLGYYRFTTGMSCYLLREGIYASAVFWGKAKLERDYSFCQNPLVSSVISGIIATVLSQPLDTTATAMCRNEKRLGPLKTASLMYREDGLKRFYRGTLLRGYAIIAGILVMSTTINTVKSLHGQENKC
jgi:hypothetical protein